MLSDSPQSTCVGVDWSGTCCIQTRPKQGLFSNKMALLDPRCTPAPAAVDSFRCCLSLSFLVSSSQPSPIYGRQGQGRWAVAERCWAHMRPSDPRWTVWIRPSMHPQGALCTVLCAWDSHTTARTCGIVRESQSQAVKLIKTVMCGHRSDY